MKSSSMSRCYVNACVQFGTSRVSKHIGSSFSHISCKCKPMSHVARGKRQGIKVISCLRLSHCVLHTDKELSVLVKLQSLIGNVAKKETSIVSSFCLTSKTFK